MRFSLLRAPLTQLAHGAKELVLQPLLMTRQFVPFLEISDEDLAHRRVELARQILGLLVVHPTFCGVEPRDLPSRCDHALGQHQLEGIALVDAGEDRVAKRVVVGLRLARQDGLSAAEDAGLEGVE